LAETVVFREFLAIVIGIDGELKPSASSLDSADASRFSEEKIKNPHFPA
jgi:hypothetical protein